MKALLSLSFLSLFYLAACSNGSEKNVSKNAANAQEQVSNKINVAAEKTEKTAKERSQSVQDVSAVVSDMMKGVRDATGTMMASHHYEPIDFQKLRAVLPMELTGFERGDSSGERNNAFGIEVSEVRQSFRSTDGKRSLRYVITDPGTLDGPMALAYAWMSVDIDKKNSESYEKTATIKGRKIHEKWNQLSAQGDLTMVVGERFVVEIQSSGVAMEELRQLVDKIDIIKLEAMKKESKKKAN